MAGQGRALHRPGRRRSSTGACPKRYLGLTSRQRGFTPRRADPKCEQDQLRAPGSWGRSMRGQHSEAVNLWHGWQVAAGSGARRAAARAGLPSDPAMDRIGCERAGRWPGLPSCTGSGQLWTAPLCRDGAIPVAEYASLQGMSLASDSDAWHCPRAGKGWAVSTDVALVVAIAGCVAALSALVFTFRKSPGRGRDGAGQAAAVPAGPDAQRQLDEAGQLADQGPMRG